MGLGCVARISEAGSTLARPDVLHLDDLDFLTTTTHAYLEPTTSSLRRMFVFHASSGPHAIVALFNILESNVVTAAHAAEVLPTVPANAVVAGADVPVSATGHVWFCGPTGHDKIGSRSLHAVFDAQNRALGVEGNTVEFRVHHVKNVRGAWDGLSVQLGTIRRERQGPTVVTVQTPLPKAVLLTVCGGLQDFPIVTRASDAADNAVVSLGWQVRWVCVYCVWS